MTKVAYFTARRIRHPACQPRRVGQTPVHSTAIGRGFSRCPSCPRMFAATWCRFSSGCPRPYRCRRGPVHSDPRSLTGQVPRAWVKAQCRLRCAVGSEKWKRREGGRPMFTTPPRSSRAPAPAPGRRQGEVVDINLSAGGRENGGIGDLGPSPPATPALLITVTSPPWRSILRPDTSVTSATVAPGGHCTEPQGPGASTLRAPRRPSAPAPCFPIAADPRLAPSPGRRCPNSLSAHCSAP